jgi:hypothetical protein
VHDSTFHTEKTSSSIQTFNGSTHSHGKQSSGPLKPKKEVHDTNPRMNVSNWNDPPRPTPAPPTKHLSVAANTVELKNWDSKPVQRSQPQLPPIQQQWQQHHPQPQPQPQSQPQPQRQQQPYSDWTAFGPAANQAQNPRPMVSDWSTSAPVVTKTVPQQPFAFSDWNAPIQEPLPPAQTRVAPIAAQPTSTPALTQAHPIIQSSFADWNNIPTPARPAPQQQQQRPTSPLTGWDDGMQASPAPVVPTPQIATSSNLARPAFLPDWDIPTPTPTPMHSQGGLSQVPLGFGNFGAPAATISMSTDQRAAPIQQQFSSNAHQSNAANQTQLASTNAVLETPVQSSAVPNWLDSAPHQPKSAVTPQSSPFSDSIPPASHAAPATTITASPVLSQSQDSNIPAQPLPRVQMNSSELPGFGESSYLGYISGPPSLPARPIPGSTVTPVPAPRAPTTVFTQSPAVPPHVASKTAGRSVLHAPMDTIAKGGETYF